VKSAAGGAPNVGAAGTGARVCAELSQGISVIPVHSVIGIKNAYAGCLMESCPPDCKCPAFAKATARQAM